MGVRVFTRFSSLLLIVVGLVACGGNENEGTTNSSVVINGAVQKGPFIVGTPVFVNRLDESGNASESVVISEIKDSVGSFSFTLSESGPVQIVSTGYYFSELTGKISNGTLTLKAIYNASSENEQVAFVNILTHLINDRILELIKTGETDIDVATIQAQDEFALAFQNVLPISKTSFFNKLSVYENDGIGNSPLGNAYLLALSATFYKHATLKAEAQNTSVDSQLSLLLNQVAKDFSDDGQIQQIPNLIHDLTYALRLLNPVEISNNLLNRSKIDYSIPHVIPDISQFFGVCAGADECMWSSVSPLPHATADHGTTVYQGEIYSFGGNAAATPDSVALTYNPATNQWTKKEPMPYTFRFVQAHTIGNKIYVIGANYSGDNDITLEYDPVADAWQEKSRRPRHRRFFMSEVVNGKIYVFGTSLLPNGDAYPIDEDRFVEIYDPVTDQWTTGSLAPFYLRFAASCVINDDIYILGGQANNFTKANTHVYNVTSDTWSVRSPTPFVRYGHTCVSVGTDFYLFGGSIWSNNELSWPTVVEVYSTETDTWREVSQLPTIRRHLSGEIIGQSIYVIGGVHPKRGVRNDVEVMDTSLINTY